MRTLVISLLLALIIAPRVQAHHNYEAAYDGKRLITLKGSVTRFKLQNPHSEIYLEVTEADGKHVWKVVTVPVSKALRFGMSKEFLKPGDIITVTGWPARSGAREVGGHTLTTPDGKEILLRPSIKVVRQ